MIEVDISNWKPNSGIFREIIKQWRKSMLDRPLDFADYSSDTLRDWVVEMQSIIHSREIHSQSKQKTGFGPPFSQEELAEMAVRGKDRLEMLKTEKSRLTETLYDIYQKTTAIGLRELVGSIKDIDSEINKFIGSPINEYHRKRERDRQDMLTRKYDNITDMIMNAGKDSADAYIRERATIANILWEDFGMVTEETMHKANQLQKDISFVKRYSMEPGKFQEVIKDNQALVDPRPEADMVNHPPHYTQGKIEVIDFIDDKQLGFYEGQVIKYVSRAKLKGNELQDLKKAQWYLNRLISNMEGEKSCE